MKNPIATIALTFLIYSQQAFTQSAVNYGSNNGKYETVNGTRLYYEEYGKGTPLLLIHGGLSSIGDMAAVIPELAKYFRVIAVDCPGQGRSEQSPTLSYQLMADYFLKMADQLKLDSLYVFGYSDGGNVALLMAADRPDKVKKTAAFASAANTGGYYPQFTAGLDQLDPAKVQKDYKWWLDVHLQKTPQKDKWQKFISDFSKMCGTAVIVPEEKLRKISTSVLIIQGDNDIVKPEHALQMHREVKASQLCIVPAASHFILWEKPAVLNLLVSEFFTKEAKLFDWSTM